MSYAKASDQDLVSALQDGVHEALSEIFKRYWKPLYLTAYYKLRLHEVAEEIVQDLFSELWEKRDRLFRGEETNLGAYLQRAIKNKVLNHIRKYVYERKYWEYCKHHLPSSEANADALAEYNDLQEQLDVALGRLSDKTKEIFVLHRIKGVPVVKISEQLNLSEKAVGYHLTKSVKELRVHLRDFIT